MAASEDDKMPRSGLLLVAGWLAALAASFAWSVHALQERIDDQALAFAKVAHQKHVDYRAWVAKRGGVYVEASALTPPNPHLAGLVDDRDVVTTGGKHLTLVNPAYMTRQVMEESNHDGGILSRLTSLTPIRPENIADPWEATALQQIAAGKSRSVQQVTGVNGSEYFRYIEALYVESACLKCHRQQGYKVGEVRGGISILVPMAPIRQAIAPERQFLAISHAAIGLLGVLLIVSLLRRVARANTRVRHSNDQLAAARDAALADKQRIEQVHDRLVATHQQLLQSDKLASIGKLAGGVAHEINTPLAYVGANLDTLRDYANELSALLGRVEALASRGGDNAACSEIWRAIGEVDYPAIRDDIPPLVADSLKGIHHIGDIVANLRAFARPEQEQALASVSLNDCCAQTLAVAAHEIRDHAEVRREFSPIAEMPQIAVRPSEINQVLLNLILNAVQAMSQRGVLTVRTGRGERTCWVEVEDTGCGIPVEIQGRIFEPFFTTKPVGSGTGLGLSIAYGIAKAHGGTLSFLSRPGEGTVFRLELPIR